MKKNTWKKTYTEEDIIEKNTHKKQKKVGLIGPISKEKIHCPIKVAWSKKEKNDPIDIWKKITI